MLSPQPADFCMQCHAPIYWVRGEYRFTCLCNLAGHPPEMPQIAPQSLSVASDQPEEEITPYRASKIYQRLFRAIYQHQATCHECTEYAAISDTMCFEQKSLWAALRFWGRHMETEENLSA